MQSRHTVAGKVYPQPLVVERCLESESHFAVCPFTGRCMNFVQRQTRADLLCQPDARGHCQLIVVADKVGRLLHEFWTSALLRTRSACHKSCRKNPASRRPVSAPGGVA